MEKGSSSAEAEKLLQKCRFEDLGPRHLLHPQWSDPDQKRAVLACLVKSVTVMEIERQFQNTGQQEIAVKWWRPFNYKLSRTILSTWTHSVIGAVFKWDYGRRKSSPSSYKKQPPDAPKVVFAFRGTMTKGDLAWGDYIADASILLQVLHKRRRFTKSYKEVSEDINRFGARNVCIAGHSLGASLALLIGRTVAKEGIHVDTHLFNPPFPATPYDKIFGNSDLRNTLHNMRNLITVLMSSMLQNDESRREAVSEFLALERWKPHLYINMADGICSSYIDYFRVRSCIPEINLVMNATSHIGLAGIAASFQGSKPLHLVPSCYLHTVENNSKDLKEAHGIQQWWGAKLHVSRHEIDMSPNKDFMKFLESGS